MIQLIVNNGWMGAVRYNSRLQSLSSMRGTTIRSRIRHLIRWPVNVNDRSALCKDVADYCMTREGRKAGSWNSTSRVDSMLTGLKEACDTQVKKMRLATVSEEKSSPSTDSWQLPACHAL